MPGPIDPRSSKGYQPLQLPLNKGLDLVGSLSSREPGSLRETLNVSVIDGNLQTAAAPVRLGTGKASDIPWGDLWTLETTSVSYTGTRPTTPCPVKWFYGSTRGDYDQTRAAAAGTGYITYLASGGYNNAAIYIITHTKGLPPSGATYFEWDGNVTGTLTINSVVVRFSNVETPSDTLGNSPTWSSYSAIKSLLAATVDIATGAHAVGSGATSGTYTGVPGQNSISHVFGHSDALYAVRDWPMLELDETREIIDPYSAVELKFGGTTYYATCVRHERGWPGVPSSIDKDGLYSRIYLAPDVTNNSITDLNNLLSIPASGDLWEVWLPGGTYRVGVMAAYDETTQNLQARSHGVCFKLDTTQDGIGENWEWLPIGYSLEFDGGIVDPKIGDGPLLPSDSLPYLTDSGWLDPWAIDISSGGPAPGSNRIGWVNKNNMMSEDGVFATGTLGATNDGMEGFFAKFYPPPEVDTTNNLGNVKLTGIEVRIKAKSTGAGSRLEDVTVMVRDGYNIDGIPLQPNKGYGDNYAYGDILSGTNTWYTFGGQTEIWGLDNIDITDTWSSFATYVSIRIDDTAADSPTISVDSVQIKYHYLLERPRLYLHDPITSTDVAVMDVHGLQVHDGDWSTDDAKGWMAVQDLVATTTVNDIWDIPFRRGQEIRTAASGGGTLIATAKSLKANVLPGSDAITALNSRMNMRVGTIGNETVEERVYVTNGAGPAFSIDKQDRFQFIRLPIDLAKDKPRHVEIIPNHLLLATEEHLLISSIGNFNNFATFDGATVWALNDKITGLQRMPDNTVVIGCSRALQSLQGSSASGNDAFRIQHISSTRGCLNNSMVLADDLYMLSENGVVGLSTSDKFGDFEGGSLSAHVEPYLRPRLAKRRTVGSFTKTKSGAPSTYSYLNDVGDFNARGFLGALPMRMNNQILYFFADSDILVGTLPGSNAPGQQRIEYTVHNYNATIARASSIYEKHYVYPSDPLSHRYTAGCSFLTGDGKEWVVVGTASGNVMRLGVGYHACTAYAFSTNPVPADPALLGSIQVEKCTLLASHYLGHDTAIVQAPDMEPPVWRANGSYNTTTDQEIVFQTLPVTGTQTAQHYGDFITHTCTSYSPATSSAFSWAVCTQGYTLYMPLYYHQLTPSVAGRASGKTFTQRGSYYSGDNQTLHYNY